MSQNSNLIDTTGDEIEEAVADNTPAGNTDPAMAVVSALAQQLQAAYGDRPEKLHEATRLLRAAHNGKPPMT